MRESKAVFQSVGHHDAFGYLARRSMDICVLGGGALVVHVARKGFALAALPQPIRKSGKDRFGGVCALSGVFGLGVL